MTHCSLCERTKQNLRNRVRDLEREAHDLKCKLSDYVALEEERAWNEREKVKEARIELGRALREKEALEKEKQELLAQIYSLAFPTESC